MAITKMPDLRDVYNFVGLQTLLGILTEVFDCPRDIYLIDYSRCRYLYWHMLSSFGSEIAEVSRQTSSLRSWVWPYASLRCRQVAPLAVNERKGLVSHHHLIIHPKDTYRAFETINYMISAIKTGPNASVANKLA